MLDVSFLLHIGKGLISAVTLSVVIPQAIGSFLRNRERERKNSLLCQGKCYDTRCEEPTTIKNENA